MRMAELTVAVVREPGENAEVLHARGCGPLILWLSVVAIMFSALEIGILISLDSMMLFMTVREILLDAGVALIPTLFLATGWWLCMLFLRKLLSIAPRWRPDSESFFWRVGIAVPLIYLVVEIFNSIRLQVAPRWHPGLSWLGIVPALAALCAIGVSIPDICTLQRLSRSRLVPIAVAHFVVVAVFAIAVGAEGIHLFRDFAKPGKSYVASSAQPDVYLITIDALRIEDMSLYGYQRPTTPNLDRFSAKAYVFDKFFANSNFTTPATTSIETGKFPWTHKVFQLGGFLRGEARQETLASSLQKEGYYTASISDNAYAGPVQHRTIASYDAVEFPLPEDGSGPWTRYTNLVGLNTLHTLSYSMLESFAFVRAYFDAVVWSRRSATPAEPVFDEARNIIARTDISQPRFVWAHILPPHDPYFPPPPYLGRFLPGKKLTRSYEFLGFRNDSPPRSVSIEELRARYDENILYADQAVGNFLDWLDQTGRLDRSIVIISSDHGESFEHGWFSHTGPFLYNGLIRIPLLIHLPGQTQGSRIGQIAEQVDLLPTILDLIGEPPPAWAEGVSLKPSLEGKPLPDRFVFSMNLEPNSSFKPITNGTVAVMDDQFKYVTRLGTNDAALYQYHADPQEERNLVKSEPSISGRMEQALRGKLEQVNRFIHH
jgi:arylsulfatase A-like enzyme